MKAVFDTEEAKSTGVMNRLLAEKNNPQAEVYWSNEQCEPTCCFNKGSQLRSNRRTRAIPEQFKDAHRATGPAFRRVPVCSWWIARQS